MLLPHPERPHGNRGREEYGFAPGVRGISLAVCLTSGGGSHT